MKLSTSILGVLVVCCPVTALAQDAPVDTLEVSVEQGIQLVLNRSIPHSYGGALILRAGASRDPAYIPLLKQVIDAWAAGGRSNNYSYRPNGGHTYVALYSLWLIGGSEDYFRTNLHHWKEDYNLAHLSAQMLALNPTPEFLEELERVCEVSNNPNGSNYLWGDLSTAKFVAEAKRAYEALPSDAARAQYVVNHVAGYWPGGCCSR